ncbi:GntR family transcriptional regulator [soil metagenome]
MLKDDDELKMTSASETAYLKIRELILTGELRSGDQVVADDLAKMFGLSRTPLREAILRLQAEMFVTRLDNKRTVVRPWSADEIDDFVELRIRLASYTAVRAAQRITDQHLATLKKIYAESAASLTENYDYVRSSEIFDQFYVLILEIADSERLRRISWHLLHPGPLLQTFERNIQKHHDMLRDHRELILAMEARDPLWAEAAMIAHVRKSYQAKDWSSASEKA